MNGYACSKCIKLTLVATSCVAISIAGSHANQRRIRSLNHYNNYVYAHNAKYQIVLYPYYVDENLVFDRYLSKIFTVISHMTLHSYGVLHQIQYLDDFLFSLPDKSKKHPENNVIAKRC